MAAQRLLMLASCLCTLLVIPDGGHGIQQGTSPFNPCALVKSYGAELPEKRLWPTPSQLRLSLTKMDGELGLSWASTTKLVGLAVKYGKEAGNLRYVVPTRNISLTRYIKAAHDQDFGATRQSSPYIYRTLFRQLEPSTRYYYQVVYKEDVFAVNPSGISVYSFKTRPHREDPTTRDRPVRWIFLADHGTKPKSRRTARAMQQFVVERGDIDLIVHGGDMAYANGRDYLWDAWGAMMEPLTARLPYMVVAGNHELVPGDSGYENGVALASRFLMPYPRTVQRFDRTASGRAFWYSFDFGPVHFIAISTEHDNDPRQMVWLEQDLQDAERCSSTQWIITFGHAPIYTSNERHGNKTELRYWLASLLDKHSVDLSLWGHDHSYERLYPIREDKVVGGGSYNPVLGTVHVICGSSGWDLHNCWKDTEMSAFHTAQYWGFLTVQALNSTIMHIDFLNIDGMSVVDSVTIVRRKARHGAPKPHTWAESTPSASPLSSSIPTTVSKAPLFTSQFLRPTASPSSDAASNPLTSISNSSVCCNATPLLTATTTTPMVRSTNATQVKLNGTVVNLTRDAAMNNINGQVSTGPGDNVTDRTHDRSNSDDAERRHRLLAFAWLIGGCIVAILLCAVMRQLGFCGRRRKSIRKKPIMLRVSSGGQSLLDNDESEEEDPA